MLFAVSTRERLRSTAYLLCGDWDRAADHVQEGLIRVYLAWPRIEKRGQEVAYARRAVVSAFLDASRRRSWRERPSLIGDLSPSTEDLATQVTDRVALLSALDQLAPRQRACVVLRYFEDLDVRQTAATLGCSEGTVKSQTSRGLDALRASIHLGTDDELPLSDRPGLPTSTDRRA